MADAQLYHTARRLTTLGCYHNKSKKLILAHYSRVDKEDEEAAKGVRKRERFGRGLILQLREAIFVLFIAIRYIK